MRVALVNMPFAAANRPSFALSQLATLTRRELPDSTVEVCYLNQDFAQHLGPAIYDSIVDDIEHMVTGLGEWIFRPVAFPDAPDNVSEYFHRYYRGTRWAGLRERVMEVRSGIGEFCAALVDRYALEAADVVGFTSMFAQHSASIAMANLIKVRNPAVITVVGGANCEAPMGTVTARRVSTMDAVFSGPALHTFPRFLHSLRDGTPAALDTIPGVLTRHNVDLAPAASSIGADRSIDDDIPPDYSSFVTAYNANAAALDDGRGSSRPVLMFETSRGCWWGERSHCTFCGLNGLGMGYRSMAPAAALRQFERLLELAPWCREFTCTDNIMPKSYPKEVFPHLRPPAGVSFFYEIKLPLSEAELRSMAAAGVTQVQPGIEAMATSTLKLMRKGTTAFLNLQFLKSCVRFGMDPEWNLLIGFPGEAEEVYEKYQSDLPLMRHLPPPTGAYTVRFDRFSPYFDHADEYGLELRPMDFYGLTYPFPEEDLAGMAYYFADRKLSPYMVQAAKWLRPLKNIVDQWRRAWDGQPPADRPRLELTRTQAHGATITDTRFGQPRSFPVPEPAAGLLRRLDAPRRVAWLAAEAGLPEAEVAGWLDWLGARDLLFREDDRVMSLVIPADGDREGDGGGS